MMNIIIRLLLLIIIISLPVLFLFISIYSNDPLENNQIPLLNRINILSNKSNDYLHNKIIQNIQNSANFGFIHTCIASLSVIVVSEIGDKTFIFAAVMSMRHSIFIVFIGTISALGIMTIISTLLGNIVTNFIPRIFTHYLSIILFVFFGTKMLSDSYYMSANEGTNEYEEIQHEIERVTRINDLKAEGNEEGNDTINNLIKENHQKNIPITTYHYISPIFIQIFCMTFLAEWGDRSQITTIVLAANENLLGVIIGGTIGHGLCTGLAVIGGRFISQRISTETITLISGVLFLLFAILTFFVVPEK